MPDLLNDVWTQVMESQIPKQEFIPKAPVENIPKENVKTIDLPALCEEFYRASARIAEIRTILQDYLVANNLKQYKENGFTLTMVPSKKVPKLVKEKIPQEILEAATVLVETKPYLSITRSRNNKGKTLVVNS